VSQTFYVEAEQPSVLFSAGQPDSVWFDGTLGVDRYGGLRTGSTLTEGAVYSVVSTRGAATPQELRALPHAQASEALAPYLQLPSEVPERVRALAERITGGAASDYAKVKAIESWLAANYHYNLDSPVPPPGADAVDYFLFESDVGFCEQFASATVVMLRELGIPARLVAGYTPGRHNPFTGLYEVRNSDAHTWVEAYFPTYGWYEFDPTFKVPAAREDLASTIPGVRLLGAVFSGLRNVLPKDLGGAARSGLAGVLVLVAIVGVAIATRKLRKERRVPALPQPIAAGPVTRAFRRFEDALASRGAGRAPPETAAELMKRASRELMTEGGSSSAAVGVFEKERYGDAPPAPKDIEAAVAELERLAERAVGTGTAPPR
jgi:hypothetical protein